MKFNTHPLKTQIEQQPLLAAGVAATLLQGAASLLRANTQRKNAKTWKKEVDRRTKATRR
jgi:hypothetical protein